MWKQLQPYAFAVPAGTTLLGRDAVLASGQLKPGLRAQDGKRYESWAQSIARIHQLLLANFERKSK